MLTAPSGTPASCIKRARCSTDNGVRVLGFKITGQPDAMAGPSLWEARLSGKLNGAIPPTTPAGNHLTSPSLRLPAGVQSSPRYSPPIRRASSAATKKVWMARSTSPKAYLTGLAASKAISRAKTSLSVFINSTRFIRMADRSCAGWLSNLWRIASAAPTAISYSA